VTSETADDDAAALPMRPCAGIMVLDRVGRVLVAQRNDRNSDAWQMPQGGIDTGETPRQAALRELEEEIGTANVEIIGETEGWLDYDLPADLVGQVWGGRFRGQTQKWFAVRFLGDDSEIDVNRGAHTEFDNWRWLEPALLPDVIVPFKKAVYEALLVEFAGLIDDLRRQA
jgi:putative (di)nucleoside polyphosphate hydrolase